MQTSIERLAPSKPINRVSKHPAGMIIAERTSSGTRQPHECEEPGCKHKLFRSDQQADAGSVQQQAAPFTLQVTLDQQKGLLNLLKSINEAH